MVTIDSEYVLADDISPTPRPSKREKRMGSILDFLLATSPTSVDVLTEEFGVSAMTIYRDIADLEADGLVIRNHGEVSAAASTLVESSARLRTHANVELKKRLADAALKQIRRGDSVILDDSTTNLHLFPEIFNLTPLTIITNARFISRQVAPGPQMRLVSTGGDYLNWADAYFGPLTVHAISTMRADLCIMSSSAVHGGHCYHPDALVAQTKRSMLQAANRNILIVDHSKFLRTALHQVGPLEDFSTVITDSETPRRELDMLESRGLEVIVA